MSNGYGSCHKIDSKNKRKCPYRVRVTDRWEFDEKTGKAVQKYRTLGYYPTRKEGLAALAEYNKNPAALGTADITFEMLFEMWKEKKQDKWTSQNERGYRAAYNHSEPLHKMKVKDIRAEHLEKIMTSVGAGVSTQKRIKTFWNQLFKFAMERDIIHKSYAEFIGTRDKSSTISNRKPFTREQIQRLWANLDMEGVQDILILIYTGMRPSELLEIHKNNVYCDERYMIGGMKTAAGRDRVIPIHKSVLPLIERKLQSTGDYLVSMKNGKQMQYRYFLEYIWKPVKDKLELEDLSPHCCRHTFVSLMTEAGADQRLLKEIVGHSTGDITQRYTKISIERKVQEVDLLEQ